MPRDVFASIRSNRACTSWSSANPAIKRLISCTTLSPRIGVTIPLPQRPGGARLFAGFSRNYHLLPASCANYANPNSLLNSSGRLFFDRAYVGKIAGYVHLPWGMQSASVIKYLDGLPFRRALIVTGLSQGPFIVMATPRGQPGGMRSEFNLTFDQRIGRELELGGFKASLVVDVFNLFNLAKHLREYDLSGPLFPLRRPLEVLNPRVVRFGLRLHL
jgi:hypothetical protein